MREEEKQREGEGERASENVGLSEEREGCFLVLNKRVFLFFYYFI